MMAGVGVGVYRDFAEAKAAVVEVQREFLPNPANRQIYDDLYGVFLELYPALKRAVSRSWPGGESERERLPATFGDAESSRARWPW